MVKCDGGPVEGSRKQVEVRDWGGPGESDLVPSRGSRFPGEPVSPGAMGDPWDSEWSFPRLMGFEGSFPEDRIFRKDYTGRRGKQTRLCHSGPLGV